MFFGTDNFSFDIDSVFFIDRPVQLHYENARPFYALSYRLSGNAVFNGKTPDELTASDGCIALVPSGLSYAINASDEKLICIHFHPSSPLTDKITLFHTKNRSYFDRKFTELLEIWQKKQFGYRHECLSVLHKLAFMIEREYASVASDSLSSAVLSAVDFINEHFTEKISISHLAASFCMSDTYFRKLFTQKMGMPPVKYINKMKIDYALELLGTGYLSVGEVAEKCGFNDISYFSLFVKKQTGFPPSEFLAH